MLLKGLAGLIGEEVAFELTRDLLHFYMLARLLRGHTSMLLLDLFFRGLPTFIRGVVLLAAIRRMRLLSVLLLLNVLVAYFAQLLHVVLGLLLIQLVQVNEFPYVLYD